MGIAACPLSLAHSLFYCLNHDCIRPLHYAKYYTLHSTELYIIKDKWIKALKLIYQLQSN